MSSAADVHPTKGNVFVRGIRPTQSKGGLSLPDVYREDNPRAEIIAVHPESEADYKVGDIVYIVAQHGVMPLKFDGGEYFLVSEESILAYVRSMNPNVN